jgi:hypothetical protein
MRHVVVFGAPDIDTESSFWAAMIDGRVIDDDPRFHVAAPGDRAHRTYERGLGCSDHYKPPRAGDLTRFR